MAVDNWDRDVGNLLVSEMAKQMSAATTPVDHPKVAKPDAENEQRQERLYEAVNNVAARIDANAARDLEQSKSWVSNVASFFTSWMKPKQETASERHQNQTLDSIFRLNQDLLQTFHKRNGVWVGISEVSDSAQRDIAKAFSMSGCCEALSQAASKIQSLSTPQNVTEASRVATQTSGGGPGMPNIPGGNGPGNGPGGHGPGSPGGSGGASSGGASGGGMGGGQVARASGQWAAFGTILLSVGERLRDIHHQLVSTLQIDAYDRIFKGVIADSLIFRESIRQTVHQQQGFGATNREIEKGYRDLDDHIAASGIRRNEYREIFLKNMEKGLSYETESDRLAAKGEKADKKEIAVLNSRLNRMKSIQTSAVSTAKALHMSTSATNDVFMSWHMQLGMSEQSLGEMGRHMKRVSRDSGLTGAALEQAMKSADGIAKNMKKSGVASIDAVKNVNSFMASAQKYGFEGATDMMNALATREGFLESKQKTFLLRSAAALGGDQGRQAVSDLQMGRTLQTPQGMKNLMQGQENLVRQTMSHFEANLKNVGASSKNLDVANLDQVVQDLLASKDIGDQAAANNIILMFKNLGMEVGEISQSFKALKEASKTPLDRIADFKSQITALEAANQTNSAEYKRLKKVMAEAETDMSMDAFSRMGRFSQQIADNGGVIGADLQKRMANSLEGAFGNESKTKDFLNKLPEEATKLVTDMSSRSKEAGIEFGALIAKKGFKSESALRDALAKGDKNAIEAMQEVSQNIQKKDTRGQDPITDIRGTLDDINNKLGQMTDGILGFLPDIVQKILYMAGYIGGFLISIIGMLSFTRGLGSLLSGLGGLGGLLGGSRGGGFPGVPGGGMPGGGMPGGGMPGGGMPAPHGPSPVGTPSGVPAAPSAGPTGPVVNPRGGRTLGTGPNVPDYGGRGWAGAMGTQVQRTTVVDAATGQRVRSGMSRKERVQNAQKYLAARQAGGQSGKGFGSAYRRGGMRGPRGGGWKGMLMRAGSFALNNPELVGAGVGAGYGYLSSDSETTMGALGDSLKGAAGGAAVGLGARYLTSGGLKAGGLPAAAGTAAMMGTDMMSGMPGYGSNCIPVCIVGGLDGLAGMMPGMAGGGGLAGTALDTLNTVDMVSDIAGMAGKGGNVVKAADKVDDAAKAGGWLSKMFGGGNKAASAVAGGADDVAKAGGWFARTMSRVPGGATVLERGAQLATSVQGTVATAGSNATNLLGGAQKVVTNFGDDIAARVATNMPRLTQFGGAASTTLKGAGAVLGKLAGPLSLAVGGLTGAMEAQEAGRTTTEGAIYGALTGGAHKGSFASEMIGLEKGGAADELLGVAGAAGVGAMTGAAIGSVVPVIGTAVGAGVGAIIGGGAELVKVFTSEESGLRDAIGGFAESVGKTVMDLPNTIGGAFTSIGSYLGEGANSIYQSVTGFASNIGNTFTSGVDWVSKGITNFASGITSTAAEGFNSTAKENWDRMVEKGPSLSGAAGQLAGGVSDIAQGNFSQGITKTALSAIEGLGAVGQAINPLNWFQEGTKEIKQPGLAVLHEGEMVVPKDTAEKMKAVGSGPFGGGGIGSILGGGIGAMASSGGGAMISSVLSSAMGPMGMILAGPIKDAVTNLSEPVKQTLSSLSEPITKAISIGFGPLGIMAGTVSGPIKDSLMKLGEPIMKSLSPVADSLFKLGDNAGKSLDKSGAAETVIDIMATTNLEVEPIKELYKSLNDTKKVIPETSVALMGAFEGDQAKEAIDAELGTSIKFEKLLNENVMGPPSTNDIQKWNDEDWLKQRGVTFEQSPETQLLDAIDGIKNVSSEKTLAEFVNEGAFEKGESKNAIDAASGVDSKQMSYWGTAIGGAIAGPIGAAAGFIADSQMNGLSIGEALDSTLNSFSEGVKNATSALSLGLFDFDNIKEAGSQFIGSITNKDAISGAMMGAQIMGAPVLGGALGIANSLFGKKGETVEPEKDVVVKASQVGMGLFDKSQPKEALDAAQMLEQIKTNAPGMSPQELEGMKAALSYKQKDHYEHDAQAMFEKASKVAGKQTSGAYSGMVDGAYISQELGKTTGKILPQFSSLFGAIDKNKQASDAVQKQFGEMDVSQMGAFDPKATIDIQDEFMKGIIGGVMTSNPALAGVAALSQVAGQTMEKSSKGETKLTSLGLFDPDKVDEAQDDFTGSFISQISGLKGVDLNNVVKSAIVTAGGVKRTDNTTENNIVAETSKALIYGQEASDAAVALFGKQSTPNQESENRLKLGTTLDSRGQAGTNPMDYRGEMGDIYKTGTIGSNPTNYGGMYTGDVKTNPLSYTDELDQLKGDAATLSASRYNIQTAAERNKYSSMSSGDSAILPSMDSIASYLINSQATKLDQMVSHLEAIRNNTARGMGVASSDIIGAVAGDSAPSAESGIKSFSREQNRGAWPLTYHDFGAGSVTTES